MNISYKWLREYLTCDKTVDELAEILTSIGLEVGCVEKVQSIRGGLEGLVVGEVLTCVDHENSDHLHITTVNVGDAVPLQIVCGAPNVAAGQKVIVATVGTVLYHGDESFVIKRSKIRGVESFGMICAEDEIGVGASHDGIMVLPDGTPAGMPAREYFGIEDDYVIEVDITPNRADATSHYGVARDLAAYFEAHSIPYQLHRPSVDDFKVDNNSLPVEIELLDPDRCPRYSGITVTGAKVAESPKWLKERLTAIGLHPINNVVDATNYILHAFGQPLHAFDAGKIIGNKVVVKTVDAGTVFITLDDVERTLSDEDLMICNAVEPMCIGGVFGGLKSGVTTDTTSIFIESAYFNPVSIRKSARRFGLNTDASFRYERGIDPHQTVYILKYAAKLIAGLTGGRISSEITDIYPVPIDDFTVKVTFRRIRSLIGKEIEHDMIERILKGLEMEILERNDEGYTLRVPAYRVDVQRDVDVIEDILRIYGYNNVEISDRLVANISFSKGVDGNHWQNIISEQLTANGFNEILNNSLTKSAYYANLTGYTADTCVKVINSLSQDLNVMRQTLLFGGLECIARNANRQNADLKFYEFGNCYHYDGTKRDAVDRLRPYSEECHLAMWITGRKNAANWAVPADKVTFYQLKAYVQNVLVRMGMDLHRLSIAESSDDLLSESLVISTAGGRLIASLGVVGASLLKTFGIDAPVYYADIQWQVALKELGKHKVKYAEFSKYPAVSRDLALLVDTRISFAEIESIAYATEKKLLKNVVLFDVYEGKNLEAGKKSYAVNFTLQDSDRTLNDSQIDQIMKRLIGAYEQKLGARLR
ncbi:MAG: phenylalanine--tRNA ligase subunit beta [Candidatus Aphodosoma sp.]